HTAPLGAHARSRRPPPGAPKDAVYAALERPHHPLGGLAAPGVKRRSQPRIGRYAAKLLRQRAGLPRLSGRPALTGGHDGMAELQQAPVPALAPGADVNDNAVAEGFLGHLGVDVA